MSVKKFPDVVPVLRVHRDPAVPDGPPQPDRVLPVLRLHLPPVHRVEAPPPVARLPHRIRQLDAEEPGLGSR